MGLTSAHVLFLGRGATAKVSWSAAIQEQVVPRQRDHLLAMSQTSDQLAEVLDNLGWRYPLPTLLGLAMRPLTGSIDI
jgi:hypothetical protein